MSCEKYTELMSAALDGVCTAEERRELDSHLAVCPECAALFNILSANAKAARDLDCEVPADLKSRIMSSLPAQEQPAKQGKVIHWKRWIPVAAAACLILVVSLIPGSIGGLSKDAMNESAPGAAPAASTSIEKPDYSRDGDAYGIHDTAEEPEANAESYGGATPAEPVPSCEPANPGYTLSNPQAIRVSYGFRPNPGAVVVDSTEGLEAYLDGFRSLMWDAEGKPIPILIAELEALKQTYTADYFRTHRLLCVVVLSGSSSNRFELHSLTRDTVTVLSHISEVSTSDMAAWLLVAEVDTTFNAGDTLEVDIIREAVSTEYSLSNQQFIHIGINCTPGAQIIDSVESLEEYLSDLRINLVRYMTVDESNALVRGNMTADEFEALYEAHQEEFFGNYTKRFFRKHHLLCVIVRTPTCCNRYELDSLTRDTVTVLQTAYGLGDAVDAYLLIAEVDTVFNDGDTLEVNIIRK